MVVVDRSKLYDHRAKAQAEQEKQRKADLKFSDAMDAGKAKLPVAKGHKPLSKDEKAV